MFRHTLATLRSGHVATAMHIFHTRAGVPLIKDDTQVSGRSDSVTGESKTVKQKNRRVIEFFELSRKINPFKILDFRRMRKKIG